MAMHDRSNATRPEPAAEHLIDRERPPEPDFTRQEQADATIARIEYFHPALDGRTHPGASAVRLGSLRTTAFPHGRLPSPHRQVFPHQLFVDELLEGVEWHRAFEFAAVDEERRRAHAVLD